MEKVNFQNLPSAETPINADNLNLMQDNVENAIEQVENTLEESQNIELLAISDTAPSECNIGDMYFNTETNLIYTAIETDTWGSTGEIPISNIFYIVLSEQKIYTYNGTTLISVGGGASESGGEALKVGTILPFSGTTVPDNYMICDGRAISRTTYASLFALIGTIYGSGDGSTTFNLPNLKGKVPVGLDSSDTSFDTLGETGGEKTHTLTIDEMPSHTHTATNNERIMTVNIDGGSYTFGSGSYNGTSRQLNNTGGGQPHNILQPYVVLNYIIKVSQTTPVQAQIVDGYSESTTDGYSANYVNNLVKKNNAQYNTMPNTEQVINTDGDFLVQGMSVSLTTKGGDILVSYSISISNSGGSPSFSIYVDGVRKFNALDSVASIHNSSYTTIISGIEAGTHTIEIRASRNNASSVTINAYTTKSMIAVEL